MIVFQYNPESLTPTLVVWDQSRAAATAGESASSNDTSNTAQPHNPPESFTFELELNAITVESGYRLDGFFLGLIIIQNSSIK